MPSERNRQAQGGRRLAPYPPLLQAENRGVLYTTSESEHNSEERGGMPLDVLESGSQAGTTSTTNSYPHGQSINSYLQSERISSRLTPSTESNFFGSGFSFGYIPPTSYTTSSDVQSHEDNTWNNFIDWTLSTNGVENNNYQLFSSCESSGISSNDLGNQEDGPIAFEHQGTQFDTFHESDAAEFLEDMPSQGQGMTGQDQNMPSQGQDMFSQGQNKRWDATNIYTPLNNYLGEELYKVPWSERVACISNVDQRRNLISQGVQKDQSIAAIYGESHFSPDQSADLSIPLAQTKRTDNSVFITYGIADGQAGILGKKAIAEHSQTRGCRPHGPRPEDEAFRTNQMRKLRACQVCRIKRIPCSPGLVCEACGKSSRRNALFSGLLCYRGGLVDFCSAFFPGLLTTHLDPRSLRELINENVASWSTELTVEVTCGQKFLPMKMDATIFEPKTEDIQGHYYLGTLQKEKRALIKARSVPIGIFGPDRVKLENNCRGHIASMIIHENYAEQVTSGDSLPLGRDLLQIIQKFCLQEGEGTLAYKALQMHAMSYFMKVVTTFTDDTVKNLVEKGFEIPLQQFHSSRLLNRHLKQTMHTLHQNMTKGVLELLNKQYNRKCKKDWPSSFCASILLCMSIEDIQVAIDTFIVQDAYLTGNSIEEARKASLGVCWKLEDEVFHYIAGLFHVVHQTTPLTGGTFSLDFEKHGIVMVSGIRQMVQKYYKDIHDVSSIPCLNKATFETDPETFWARNPWRLVCRFLMSFALTSDGSKKTKKTNNVKQAQGSSR